MTGTGHALPKLWRTPAHHLTGTGHALPKLWRTPAHRPGQKPSRWPPSPSDALVVSLMDDPLEQFFSYAAHFLCDKTISISMSKIYAPFKVSGYTKYELDLLKLWASRVYTS